MRILAANNVVSLRGIAVLIVVAAAVIACWWASKRRPTRLIASASLILAGLLAGRFMEPLKRELAEFFPPS